MCLEDEVLLDVTPVWERKRQAMETMEAQGRVWTTTPTEPPARDAGRAQLGAQRQHARGSV